MPHSLGPGPGGLRAETVYAAYSYFANQGNTHSNMENGPFQLARKYKEALEAVVGYVAAKSGIAGLMGGLSITKMGIKVDELALAMFAVLVIGSEESV